MIECFNWNGYLFFMWWLLVEPFDESKPDDDLLGAGVLGDGLGALGHGVLGQLTREKQTDCSLDLSGGDGGPAFVVSQAACFGGDALKDVIDKAVHDAHGLAGDTSIRVHLLQHLVDIDAVALPPFPLSLLVTPTGGLGLGNGLLSSFGCWLGWHFALMNRMSE